MVEIAVGASVLASLGMACPFSVIPVQSETALFHRFEQPIIRFLSLHSASIWGPLLLLLFVSGLTGEGRWEAGVPPTIEALKVEPEASPSIDGRIEETVWNVETPIRKHVIGAPSADARFGVLWSDDRLFVAIRVDDSKLHNDSEQPWQDDAAAVYLDGNHNDGGDYDRHDWEFIKGYADSTLFAKQRALSTGGDAPTTTRHGWTRTEQGYTVELSIPWSDLGVSPTHGDTVGLDVGVNADDDGGERDGQLMWAGTKFTFRNPSVFGDLVLSGER